MDEIDCARGARLKRFAGGLLACMLALAAGSTLAQDAWPAKPVRIIVTFTPGGAADLTARVVGEKLSEVWKQQVIVENRIGAGGNIGVEAVYRSIPDGYTLLLASTAQPMPDVREKLRAAGLKPSFRSPGQMAGMMKAEVESFKQISVAAGITAE